jgi:magnesium-transporting ATPase (P-type)
MLFLLSIKGAESMKLLEELCRKASVSFVIAALFTKSFMTTTPIIWNISVLTWGITVILFLLSWRLKKELKQILIKHDEEAHTATLWGQFETKYPRLSTIVWEFFVTFAIVHLLYIALDYLAIIETNGNRTSLFLLAIIITCTFRILDRDTYRKN